MLRKHFLQLAWLGIRDRQFSLDDLYIPGGPTIVLNGEIRVYSADSQTFSTPNREAVRFEAALTDSVSFLNRNEARAEGTWSLPPTLSGAKASWLVMRRTPIARGNTVQIEGSR